MEILVGLKKTNNLSKFSNEYLKQNNTLIKRENNEERNFNSEDYEKKVPLSSNSRKAILEDDNIFNKVKESNINSILEKISLLSKELINRKLEIEKVNKENLNLTKENLLLRESIQDLTNQKHQIMKEV